MAILFPQAAFAQTTYTWDPLGSGAGGSDSSSGSYIWDQLTADTVWYSSAVPGDSYYQDNPTNIVDIGASGTSSYTVTMNDAITLGTLNFTGTSGAAYTIAPNATNPTTDTLTIYGGINLAAGVGPTMIDAPIVLGNNNTWTNSSSSLLTIGGTVAAGGNSLAVGGGGSTTISGALSSTSGASLAVSGTGTSLTLGSISSYGGTTTVGAGSTLTLTSSDTTARSIVLTGGTLLATAGSPTDAGNLVDRWTFAGTASDSVGTSNGTLGSGATLLGSGGKFGNGYVSLNGTSNATVAMGSLPAMSSGTQARTISAWVEQTSTPAATFSSNYFGFNTSGTNKSQDFYFDNNSGVVFTEDYDDSTVVLSNASANGTWHLLTATWTGSSSSNVQIYVDGSFVTSLSSDANGPSNILDAFGIGIGGRTDFTGYEDDLRVYNTALSAAQVASIYNGGLGDVGGLTLPNTAISVTSNSSISGAAGPIYGTLSLTNSSTLSMTGGGSVTFGATTLAGNTTLDLHGVGITAASLSDAGATGTLVTNLGASAATLTLTPGSGSTTFGGIISNGAGGVSLSVNGSSSGVQILSGANTYTGLTTVSGGTLRLGAGGSINSGNALTTSGGGTFDLGGQSQTLGTVTNGGTITSSSGAPTLTIGDGSTGAGAWTGTMNIIWNQNTSTTSLTGNWTNTGNITLNATSTGTLTLATGTVNNTGTITNSGAGAGGATISAALGANVTAITEDSATSLLTISGALSANGTATTLTNGNAGGTQLLTLSGGVGTASGNLILDNNSAIASGVSLTTNSVNNTGTITNAGAGTGSTLISATIGANVTNVVEDSATSALSLTANNSAFVNKMTVALGTLSSSSATNPFGTSAATIYLGDTTAGNSHSATLLYTASGATISNALTVNPGSSGTLAISTQNSNTLSGNIALNNALTVADTNGGTLTLSGQITGSSRITIPSNSTGTISVTGADASSYTGNVLLDAGILKLSTATSTLSAASLTTGGTSTFNYASPSGGGTQAVGALTFAGGDATIQSTWNTSGTTDLTFASASRTNGAGATGNFILSGGTAGTPGSPGTLGTNNIIITGQAPGFIDPGIFYEGGTATAAYAAYDAGGFVRAYSYTTDAGGVTSGAGATIASNATGPDSSSIGASSNVLLSGAITGQTTTQIETLDPATYSLTLGSGQILMVDGLLKTGNSAGGTVTAAGGTGGSGGIEPGNNSDLVVRTDQGADSLTLTSNILAGGSGALVKSGAGTLTLTSGYSNNLTGGLFLNGGTYAVSSDAALGAPGDPITFNGGGLKFNTAFNPDPTRAISVNAGGGTITATGTIAVGSSITDVGGLSVNNTATTTFNGNISGPGGFTFSNSGTVILSGSNSFTGNIYNSANNVVQLNGATAGGTGTIYTQTGSFNENNTVNLRSDTSATFTVSAVSFSATEDYSGSSSTINVGPITSGVTGQTLALNTVNGPADQQGNGFTFSSTAGSSYTLDINTLNLATNATTTVNANTAVAIGVLNFSNGNQVQPYLSGSVGGTVGRIVNSFGANKGGINVVGGTWTFTGANSYGTGPWTNNATNAYETTGGTEISGAGTILVINQDLALGTAPGSVAANNIGLVNGGTVRTSTTFTLNSNRGIGLGNYNGSANDTGVLDVASGQTLTYNGIIASSGTTGIVNLTTTPSGGTLILGGANTYNGATNINGGTLLLNNSTLTTGTGAVNVASAATLGGNGTIKGAIALSGTATLSPGFSSTGTGSLVLSGNPLTLLAGTTSDFAISSASPSGDTITGTQITGVGALTYGGTLNVSAVGNPNYAVGEVYTLFPSFTSESGTFSTLNLPNISPDGLKWSAFNYTSGSLTILPIGPSYANPEYTLSITAAATNAHVGAAVGLTTTIVNTGGALTSDSISYTGLGATLTGGSGGTIVGPTGGTGSGDVAYNASGFTSGLTYSNSTPGAYTFTAAVGAATGDNGTTPSQNGSSGTATINLYTGISNWNTANSGNWSSYGNWDAGGAPGVYASNPTGDSATFGTQGSGPITVTVDVPVSLTTLNFNSTTTNYAVAAGSGSLAMNGSGAAINVAGNHTIAAPLTLAGNTTITTTNSTDSLTISGAIGGSGDGSGTSLTTSGPGLVVLSGNNTYTGGTSIGSGTLRIGNGGASGTLGGDPVTDNATLAFDRSDTALVVSNSIGGTGVVNQIGSGRTTISGTNGYLGGTNITAGTLEFGQYASMPTTGAVAAAAGATLAVAANSSGGAAGWTSAQIDTLWNGAGLDSLASGAFLGIDSTNAASGTFTYASNVSDFGGGSTPLSLAALGSGTLVLSGASSFTGGLYLDGGYVSAGADANLGAGAGSVVFNGGNLILTAVGPTIPATRTLVMISSGAIYSAYNTYNHDTLTIASTISGSGTLSVIGGSIGGDSAQDFSTIVFSGNSTSFSGGITVQAPTVVFEGANSSGTGPLTYTQPYSGYTLRLLSDTSATFLTANVALPLFDGNTGGSVNIDVDPITGATGQTLALEQLTLTALGNNGIPSLNVTSSNGYTLSIGTLNFPNNAGSPFNLNPTSANLQIGTLNASTINLSLGGTATGNTIGTITSSNGLHIAGGTWRVTGTANTYGGATTIDGASGVLNVAALAAGGSASSIGNSSNAAGNLVFGGGTLQYTVANTSTPTTTDRLFTIGDATGNTATLDSSSPIAANTLSFTNTGTIAFADAAAHTLTLTGSNIGANTFAPLIADQSAGNATSVVKSGAGTWVLMNS